MTKDAQVSDKSVSVIIPAHNAEETIGLQLEALSKQPYSEEWEIIVVDNNSRDNTQAVVVEWQKRLPHLRIIDANKKSGPSYVRNEGARASKGELLLFCDADDVVSPGWVTAMAEGLSIYPAVGALLTPRYLIALPCARGEELNLNNH